MEQGNVIYIFKSVKIYQNDETLIIEVNLYAYKKF